MILFKIIFTKNALIYFGFFSLLLSFIHCTYDKSLIYKKEYEVKTNSLLRFDGFYCYEQQIYTEKGFTDFMYPIFFYKNGSVILMGPVKDAFQLRENISKNPKGVWGNWGNYQIFNDSIKVETIGSFGGSFHHVRNTKLGLIKKDSISFIKRIDRKSLINEINETVHFVNFNFKPDSTSNWVRKKKKYNR
jgi:hypothetical protein